MPNSRKTAPSAEAARAAALAGSRVTAWVRFKGRDLRLPTGDTVLGRSAGCQIVLDDGLVSRRHAQIVFDGTIARLDDLGSVNGVFVNGVRTEGSRQLEPGDRILIGKQEMSFHVAEASPVSGRVTLAHDRGAKTISGFETPYVGVPPMAGELSGEESEATRQGDAFDLLGGVAEKVLAMGRGEEAERILASYLRNLLVSARGGDAVNPKTADKAARFAVKLAAATGKGSWVDYAVDLYASLEEPLPADAVDELYSVLRGVSAIDLTAYRAYLAVLKEKQGQLGPSERFVLQRLEGLERLAALR